MNAAEMKAKCETIARRSIEIASRGGDRFGHGIIAKAIADAIAALPVEADPREAQIAALREALDQIFSRISYVNIHGVGLQPDPISGCPKPVRIAKDEFWRLFQEIGTIAAAALAASEPKGEGK